MHQEYSLRPSSLLFRDSPQHIDFHIRTGDYFSFLATMMGFLEEALMADEEEGSEEHTHFRKLARELRMDLRYVQANYKIVPRGLDDIQQMNPAGDLLKRR